MAFTTIRIKRISVHQDLQHHRKQKDLVQFQKSKSSVFLDLLKKKSLRLMAQKQNTKDRNRQVALGQLKKSMNLVLETMLLKKNYIWVQE